MQYKYATIIPVKISGLGKNYFPATERLRGLKVTTLNAVEDVLPFAGEAESSTYFPTLYLNLTSNGQDYIFKDTPVSRFSLTVCKGVNLPINSTLSIEDCYIECRDAAAVGGVVTIVAWYEYPDGEQAKQGGTWYDGFDAEVPTLQNNAAVGDTAQLRRVFFPDNRTLYNKSFTQLYADFPSLTPTGNTGVDATWAKQRLYVTLVRGTLKVWDRVPVACLDQIGWYIIPQLSGLQFDFQNSYIEDPGTDGLGMPANAEFLRLVVKY